MNITCYSVKSLELHLFFSRIMKEHAFFLRTGSTPAAPSFSQKAEFFLSQFEELLCDVVQLSDGIVGKGVLCSGEAVTEFTALAERQTENLTGIHIDKGITAKTLRLKPLDGRTGGLPPLHGKIRCLNRKALGLLDRLISFRNRSSKQCFRESCLL